MIGVLALLPGLVGWHFGHLSPAEQALVYALGLGPFLLLGIVVSVIRRHEGDDPDAGDETGTPDGD